ncbi:hypothetical protein [Candidatus Lokiarchaeum ossiferum]
MAEQIGGAKEQSIFQATFKILGKPPIQIGKQICLLYAPFASQVSTLASMTNYYVNKSIYDFTSGTSKLSVSDARISQKPKDQGISANADQQFLDDLASKV